MAATGFNAVALILALSVVSSTAQSAHGGYHKPDYSYYSSQDAGYGYSGPLAPTYTGSPINYYYTPLPQSGYYIPPTAEGYYYYTPGPHTTVEHGYYSSSYGYGYGGSSYGYGYASYDSYVYASYPHTYMNMPMPNMQFEIPMTTDSNTPSRRLLSEGQCYCPYDSEWRSWAVADPHCRATLYSKCRSDSLLECDWLDAYFSASQPAMTGFSRPHERDIFNYLYTDCPPAKPCSCSALTFTSKDAAADVYRCCSDLQVHAKVPFSGLTQRTVDAFCSGSSGKKNEKVRSWLRYELHRASCPAASAAAHAYSSQAASASFPLATEEVVPAPAVAVKYAAGGVPSSGLGAGVADREDARVQGLAVTAVVAGCVGGLLVVVAALAAAAMLAIKRKESEVAEYTSLA